MECGFEPFFIKRVPFYKKMVQTHIHKVSIFLFQALADL